jgi:hypothetical protein
MTGKSKSKEIADLDMHWHHETEAAILVSENGDESKAVWLPKSQTKYTKDKSGGVKVSLPTWLAEKHNLI